MISIMKKIVRRVEQLTLEERNLLSIAYKNTIGPRRASWRIISSIEKSEENKKETDNIYLPKLKEYREKIEQEMISICSEVFEVLKKQLNPSSEEDLESNVFFLKMKGDYHRYMAEFSTNEAKDSESKITHEIYEQTSEIAMKLPPTHPIRLGLAVNYTTFYYEILNSSEKASEIAKNAYNAAMAELDTLSEDQYANTVCILELLRHW
jgi:14-3-3 protein epsilon